MVRSLVLDAVGEVEKKVKRLRAAPEDAGALHGYRKSARRAWAAVQLAELYLTPVQFAKAFALAASLAQGLGSVRDQDVVRRRLRGLAKRRDGKAILGLAPAMGPRQRQKRVDAAVQRAKPSRFRRPLQAVLQDVSRASLDPLAVLRQRLRVRARRLSAHSSLHALHAFRLELKSYRYGLEALRPGKGTADARVARECRAATALLGRIVDANLLLSVAARAKDAAAVVAKAARSDDQAARKRFASAWTGNEWPALMAELRSA